MGDMFLLGKNQCHCTGVKKSYFGHTFHLRPKKVFWWTGEKWLFYLRSFRHTDTKWTQSLTKITYVFLLVLLFVTAIWRIVVFTKMSFSWIWQRKIIKEENNWCCTRNAGSESSGNTLNLTKSLTAGEPF